MTLSNNRKIKLGLALGSGGAKGACHLGALKAFEEENIKFEVFSGASIGSLMGALLARGYGVDDIFAITDEMWKNKKLALLSVMDGGLISVFRSVMGGAYFSDLKYPFSAVASDMISGEEVVFKNGDLSIALAASCAIPPTFRPVNYRGLRLVDGAFLNAVPADKCVADGAEMVIGINLSAGKNMNTSGKEVLDNMYPENRIPVTDRSKWGYKYSDFMIEPDLSEYRGYSVNRMDEMYEIGYKETKRKMPIIKAAIEAKDIYTEKDFEIARERKVIKI